VRSIGGTVVFFEAPHRIRETLEQLQREVGDCQVVVCRELTKKHEELVRGPISAVLAKISEPLGEFTVVANIGQIADLDLAVPPSPKSVLAEFGELTNNKRMSRRGAVAALAKRHRLAANVIYDLIETGKKEGH
jgi:16S rRNA (cytidine1402-2'-O)-methyltransferase